MRGLLYGPQRRWEPGWLAAYERAHPGAADRARASSAAQGFPEYVEDPEALAVWARLLGIGLQTYHPNG